MAEKRRSTNTQRAREKLKLRHAILVSREKREKLMSDEKAMIAKVKSL